MGKIIRYNGLVARYGQVVEYYPFIEASGGIISYDGDYIIHTYNVSDNFIVQGGSGNIQILLVGGGGGSGGGSASNSSGTNTSALVGAGGGGLVKETSINISSNLYYIEIGNGGAGGSDTPTDGEDGHITKFGNILDASGGKGSEAVIKTVSGAGIGLGANSGSGKLAGTNWSIYRGGAGGDGSNGINATSGGPGTGGTGTLSSITNITYGGGGGMPGKDGGGSSGQDYTGFPGIYRGTDPSSNRGGGANGMHVRCNAYSLLQASGNKGADGIVVIKYKYK